MLSSAGSGPGYDTVFSVVLMRTLQRSDAGCKCAPTPPTPKLSSTLFISASGLYLDMRDVQNVTGSFVMVLVIYLFILLLCFECNACEHGRCCVVVMCFCSAPFLSFLSVLPLLPRTLLSSTSPQTSHISSLSTVFRVGCSFQVTNESKPGNIEASLKSMQRARASFTEVMNVG